MIKKIKRYLWNILIAVDRLANTILGGSHINTLSSRMQAHREKYKLYDGILDLLEKIDKDHGIESVETDKIACKVKDAK